jgi:hypothetical protein
LINSGIIAKYRVLVFITQSISTSIGGTYLRCSAVIPNGVTGLGHLLLKETPKKHTPSTPTPTILFISDCLLKVIPCDRKIKNVAFTELQSETHIFSELAWSSGPGLRMKRGTRAACI